MNEKPETILRRAVKIGMSGTWELTWHEDRQVSPGTPDISYVMLIGYCETGWLELKALAVEAKEPYSFKLEPSQPEWMERHVNRIPVHFLVAVGKSCWLISGMDWKLLQKPIYRSTLDDIAYVRFEIPDMRAKLVPTLQQLTYRRR